MENQQESSYQLQQEITKHLCQAHAVQIKGLQNSLGETINQTTKALEECQPELASSLWKQVVQQTQNISRLFNQTSSIMYANQTAVAGASQFAFPQQTRRFNGQQSGRNRNRSSNNNQVGKQLNKLTRKVDELVAAAG